MVCLCFRVFSFFFFFNDTATTEIYTLSLHDALPIYPRGWLNSPGRRSGPGRRARLTGRQPMATDVLGARIKRVEDPRFITGKGRYLDDIKLAGMTYMSILRSPYAHANIRSIDTSAAKAMPGVVLVLVGADIPYNPLPMAWPAGGSSGVQNNINMPRVLATDSVKWTGEGVAAVIAETADQAVDALAAIVVDWEPPAVVGDAAEGH